MIQFKRILCPVDTSVCSRAALRHAAALANWHGADLTALWVRPVSAAPPVLWPAYPPWFLLPTAEERAAAEEHLRTFVRDTAGAAVTQMVFREGTVVPEILRAAAEIAPDLIVMGTHGLSGFEHLLLGSVAERVNRKATCPVLTVPRTAPLPDSGAALFKTILCAVDFSQHSTRAVEYALSLSQEAGGRLVLAHVLEHFTDDAPGVRAGLDVLEFSRTFEIEAQDRLASLVPDPACSWCEVETVVGHGRAHRELLRIAGECKAGLIMLGVHGTNALDHALFGSTAERVLHRAAIPVLTVPPVKHKAAVAA
jgi:nucleotide-binding universal stress UspA family protein